MSRKADGARSGAVARYRLVSRPDSVGTTRRQSSLAVAARALVLEPAALDRLLVGRGPLCRRPFLLERAALDRVVAVLLWWLYWIHSSSFYRGRRETA